jgi:outer membrane receptor protein involved in Fe transport
MGKSAFRLILLGTTAVLFWAPFARAAPGEEAASDGATAAPEAAKDSIPRIESVVVTARRRSEVLEQVPVSVLVLGGDELQRIGATGLLDYAGSLPGLTLDNTLATGGPKTTVRGITSGLLTETRPLTQLYFGETPINGFLGPSGSFSFPDINPIDLARIELLRGPQGTLFGASAMGGALRMIPNDPAMGVREGWVSASASAVAHGGPGWDLSGVVNAPVLEDSAVRAAGFSRQAGGWIDNLATGKQDVNATRSDGGRIAFRTKPGDWTIDLRVAGQRDRRDGFNFEAADLSRYQQSRPVPEGVDDKWSLSTLTTEWDGGTTRFISSTGWYDRNSTGRFDGSAFFSGLFGFPAMTQVTNADRIKEFTQELRWQGTTGRVDWLVGAFYLQRKYFFGQNMPTPGFDALNDPAVSGFPDAADYGYPDNILVLNSETRQREAAVFADASYRPARDVEITAGIRAFRHREDFWTENDGTLNGGASSTQYAATDRGATPRLSVSWLPDAERTFYASVAQGFRPGGPNDPTIAAIPGCGEELAAAGYTSVPASFTSDRLTSYELGAKTAWLDRRLQLNAAAFHIDWRDIQTYKTLECAGVGFTENAGRAASDGIEIDLVARPSRQWQVSLNAAYTDARFVEDVPNIGAKSGDPIPGVPQYTVTAAVTWFYMPQGYVRLDYQRVGKSTNAYDVFGAAEVPAYGYANLSAAYRSGPWEFFARVSNLTDAYAAMSLHRSFLGNWNATLTPRTVTAGVRYLW